MWRYIKEAFWARASLPTVGPLPVNALAVLGLSLLGFGEHALWLVGLGLETAYLFTLATNPRFQNVLQAQDRLRLRQNTEQNQRGLLEHLTPEERTRAEQMEEKVRQAALLTRGKGDFDLLEDSNQDALERLGALHLRLLGVEHDLQTARPQSDEADLVRQSAALEQELQGSSPGAAPLSAALRESKQATLALTQKRLINSRRRAESIAEVRSDLTRIEAQVELALEDASLEGRTTVAASNLNLLNRILESNSALRSDLPGE